MDKQALRVRLRAGRRAHVASLPESVRGLILRRPPAAVAAVIPEGAVVGLYHAVGAEAPATGFARWLQENGRRIALPRFAGVGAAMEFREWRDPWNDERLVAGPYGAMEPGEDAELLEPDWVFVPLVGFTAAGDRLGQGGGHYDRWLAAHPDVGAIGIAWDCQLCEDLPTEPHDRRLRAVVTPTRLYGDLDAD